MKNTKSEILVIGSVVRDVTIRGFDKKESLGGTGTNISFGLGVLGLRPTLVSVAGNDFSKKLLSFYSKNGITEKIFIEKSGNTAVFSMTIDKYGKEEGDWQPNVFNKVEDIKLSDFFKDKELKQVKIAIFSPGTPISTLKHMIEFRKKASKRAIVIFDPGQMTNFYSKKQLEKCIKLSDILILNKIEFEQVEKVLGKNILKLFKNKILIKTLGGDGSEIYEKEKMTHIPVVKPKKVVSTVGAGDAYRAGLIYGLLNKLKLENACKIGAKFSSKKVECIGCKKSFFKL